MDYLDLIDESIVYKSYEDILNEESEENKNEYDS